MTVRRIMLLMAALAGASGTAQAQKAKATGDNGDPVKRLDDPSPDVRIAAIRALAEEGKVSAASPIAVKLESDPDEDVRRAAAEALEQIGSARGLPSLRTCVDGDVSERVRRSCKQALRSLDAAANDQVERAPQPAPPKEPPAPKSKKKAASKKIEPVESEDEDAPDARRGFQGSFRLGYALPFGDLESVDSVSAGDVFGNQIGGMIGLGGKTSDTAYAGVYAGYWHGGVAGALAEECSFYDLKCAVNTWHVGLETQKHLGAAKKTNSWAGFGAGYEHATIGLASGVDGSLSGLELRLGFGVDTRTSEQFGVGFVADLTAGRFSKSVDPNGAEGSLDWGQQAFHFWLSFGIRAVIFP